MLIGRGARVVRIAEDERERAMVTSPRGGLDRSDHLGHLLHHFVHGSVVGCLAMMARGLAAIMRLAV